MPDCDANLSNDPGELVALLAEQLLESGKSIATVESCTGGGVAAVMTDLAGSSNWFDRGFVTYSNQAKTEMVGVSRLTLKQYGAVSEEVALEMAQGGIRHSAADCALAITGIAGPGGAMDGKPLGMVCFAWAGFDGRAKVVTRYFKGDRQAVRIQSVIYALQRAVCLIGKSA